MWYTVVSDDGLHQSFNQCDNLNIMCVERRRKLLRKRLDFTFFSEKNTTQIFGNIWHIMTYSTYYDISWLQSSCGFSINFWEVPKNLNNNIQFELCAGGTKPIVENTPKCNLPNWPHAPARSALPAINWLWPGFLKIIGLFWTLILKFYHYGFLRGRGSIFCLFTVFVMNMKKASSIPLNGLPLSWQALHVEQTY